jgi:4-alpha-glucanotransferase
MVQLQDVLGLGPEGRMNQPGSVGGWGWRVPVLPSLEIAKRLHEATDDAGRLASA